MPIDAFVCRMPTLGVPYDLYLISYTSNTAKGHWLLGVHHCPGLGYFALLHKSTCFIHRSEATAPGERTAGGCPGRPQPRFGGHGDAGTRRGEPLISDKRKRVATIHHRYKETQCSIRQTTATYTPTLMMRSHLIHMAHISIHLKTTPTTTLLQSATPKLMNPVRKQTAPAAASEDKRTCQNSYSNRVC
ncbi:uncharacterized protein [Miscanthus floridulus]|uniref:uncharacterized protein isoform X2 n=1 Tax=Miscanthus floridulus TaxID=154761 RepID=UPI003457E425